MAARPPSTASRSPSPLRGEETAHALKQRATASHALAPEKGGSGDRDPKGNSLWLLPSGPDQIGEAFARDLRGRYDDFGSPMQDRAC